MVKSRVIVLVDSVEEAVKFYTEKLYFDLVDLSVANENGPVLKQALLRKGKFGITFRQPHVEEFAAFSFIKRCAQRCIHVTVDIKRDIEKFFERCLKKNIKITKELSALSSGVLSFSVRDPFGIELCFVQGADLVVQPALKTLWGELHIDLGVAREEPSREVVIQEAMMRLRDFGIVRRAAKKLIKTKLKELGQPVNL